MMAYKTIYWLYHRGLQSVFEVSC